VWIYLAAIIVVPVLVSTLPRRGTTLPLEIALPITIVVVAIALAFHYYAHRNMLKTIEEILA
jgi:hypothetical protein